MRMIWSRMRKFQVYSWLNKEGAWMAILLFGMGCMGWGYLLATINARTARSQELSVNYDAFSVALAEKDRTILSLTKSTIVATGQAADAVATAKIATNDAAMDTKAAAAATQKAEDQSRDTKTNSKAKEQRK